eukprot:4865657-Amphidinium_carterae.1
MVVMVKSSLDFTSSSLGGQSAGPSLGLQVSIYASARHSSTRSHLSVAQTVCLSLTTSKLIISADFCILKVTAAWSLTKSKFKCTRRACTAVGSIPSATQNEREDPTQQSGGKSCALCNFYCYNPQGISLSVGQKRTLRGTVPVIASTIYVGEAERAPRDPLYEGVSRLTTVWVLEKICADFEV